MIWKLPAIFVLFAMVAFPFCSAMAKEGCGRPAWQCRQRRLAAGCGYVRKASRFSLGRLLLTQSSSNNEYRLEFSRSGRKLFEAGCAFGTHKPESAAGFPLPGCRTLLAYCFSGGAHCCTTLFIATSCGHESSLYVADLQDDQERVKFIRADGAPGKEIVVHDWQLAYYGSPDLKIQFTFADSPAMVRLLVFRDGHWRPDRAGEFSLFYSRLLRRTTDKARAAARREKTATASSLAMEAAYYDLMTGASAGRASEVLYRLLPSGFKSETGPVMQDILRAVSGFNPVEAVRQNGGPSN